jgi:NADH-quinone oxidoreductase subunit H
MADFLTGYVIPGGIIVAQILVLVVPLLIAVAMLTYADRKVWAACRCARGPTSSARSACSSPSPTCIKFVLKELDDPRGADKIVFILAPIADLPLALAAWAVIPFATGLGDLRHQRRHPLPARDLLARRLRHHHGRLGVELEVPIHGRLRSAAQMVSYEVSIGFVIITVLLCVGSLNLGDRALRQAGGFWNWHVFGAAIIVRNWLAPLISDDGGLLHLGAGRDQPPAVRPARGRVGTRGRLPSRILLDRPSCCS